MGAVDDILAGIDINQLAAQLGTDPDTARAAAAAALPSLFGSLQANASDPDGASSLLGALDQHSGSPAFGEAVDLSSINTADGQKILAHMFNEQPERLQALGGMSGSLLSRLLPLLAPIVMAYIAKKMGMGGASGRSSGNILGDLLGGILGGGQAGAGGLGDILGDILGGGQQTQSPPVPAPSAGSAADSPFRPSGGSGRLQIPIDETPEAMPEPAGTGGSADILGSLLDQILGRTR